MGMYWREGGNGSIRRHETGGGDGSIRRHETGQTSAEEMRPPSMDPMGSKLNRLIMKLGMCVCE